ncbi:hypothetical protein GALL_280960 [mine drainage metagenome]|uniref:Pilus assembly protein, PilO n=1 Tax=mine drainage metagenome TaxID=410659 RepID=A0A1J5R218_9ZZZZ
MAASRPTFLVFIRRNAIGVGCGALCLVLAVLSYFRFVAQQDAESKLDDRSSEAERIIENVKNSAQLREQVAKMKASVATIEGRLVHASDLATNLQYFYKVEADTKTTLNDLRQDPLLPLPKGKKAPEVPYTPISYSLTVQGDFPHLLAFLGELENGPHYCVIRSATFSPKSPLSEDAPAGGPRTHDLTLALKLDLLGLRQ